MVDKNIKITDQLVYIILKSHDNPEHECYPSLDLLSKETHMSVPTVRTALSRLKDADYIKIEKRGRKNYYYFNPYKKFEPFSTEFINNNNLSPTAKAYLIASQQYMFKDVEGIGKISLSNRELAKSINTSEFTVRKCNSELERNNYLTIVNNFDKDLETGCFTETKIFKLAKLGQAIIWKLKEHDDRISDNTNRIEELEKLVKEQQKTINHLLEEREKSKTEYIMY